MSTVASTGGGAVSTGVAASTGGGTPSYTGSTAGSTGGSAGGWGDDWRVRMAGGSSNEAEIKQLERYEAPDQVWRKARELEKKLSAGELRPVLAKNATADEQAAYRKAHGIPDKPEDYKINLPAGAQAPKEDDAFLKSFLKGAHEENYTQAQVDRAINQFYAEVERQSEAVGEAEQQAIQDADDKLRQEWGADYRPNMAMADALLSRAPAGFRDRFLNGYLDDHTPIKASTEAWKWLVQMEREINPAGTVVPGAGANTGKAIEAELTDIKALMANRESEYWKGPKAEAMQARYRELLGAKEKMDARG